MKSFVAGLAGMALVPLAAVPAAAANDVPAPIPARAMQSHAPSSAKDRVIVKWVPGTSKATRRAARSEAGATGADTLFGTTQVLHLAPGRTPAEALSELRANPDVTYAQRDQNLFPTALPGPNDYWYQDHPDAQGGPLPGQMWGLINYGQQILGEPDPATAGVDIKAVDAWTKTSGDPSVLVGVLDTGIMLTHPDLDANIWTDPSNPNIRGHNTFDPANPNDPSDNDIEGGHGTHVAGTIAAEANNTIGITGVAPKATILPVKVCGLTGTEITCPTSAVADGIDWAAKQGAKVINISLGTYSARSKPPRAIADAMAANPQALIVTSAGNDGVDIDKPASGGDPDPKTVFPCAFNPAKDATAPIPAGAIDNVLCVTAHKSNSDAGGPLRPDFANWGGTSVDLAAPGMSVISTYNHFQPFYDNFDPWSGATGQNTFPNAPEGAWTPGGWSYKENEPYNGFSTITPSLAKGDHTAVTPDLLQFADRGVTDTRCMVLADVYPHLKTGDTFQISAVITDNTGKEVNRVDSPKYDQTTLPESQSAVSVHLPFDVAGSNQYVRAHFSYHRAATPDPNPNLHPYGIAMDAAVVECIIRPGEGGAYAFADGTSMAAPHVAGTAALMQAWKPGVSVTQMKQAAMQTVIPAAYFGPEWDPTVSGGRLNANAALEKLKAGPTPTPTPTPSPTVTPTPPPPAPTPPPAVSSAKVKKLKKGKSAKVSWSASSGATSYKVRYAIKGKAYKAWKSTGGLAMTLSKLSPKKVYTVQIVAANAAGDSPAKTVTIKKGKK